MILHLLITYLTKYYVDVLYPKLDKIEQSILAHGFTGKINNSHIENSVIMDHVSINLNLSTMIRESLIGPSTNMDSSGMNRKFLKFIVGRDSMVEV